MSNSVAEKTYAFFKTPLNKNLVAKFTNNRVNFFQFPPLEAEKIRLKSEEIELIKNIKKFDWLIFTDVLAVDCFLQILTENDIDFFELDAVRVCAFGETVADRLRFAQIHADVIPNEINAQTIFSAIGFYAGDNDLKNLKMLLLKENSADVGAANLLQKANAELVEMPIYTAKISDKNEITKLKTLLKGGAIDEFILTAPEDLVALHYYFPNDAELKTIFEEVKATANDANIIQNLKENEIKAHYFVGS